jgi:hypothetical protein
MLGTLFGPFKVQDRREHPNQGIVRAGLEMGSSAHECCDRSLAARTERRILRESMGLGEIEEIFRRSG